MADCVQAFGVLFLALRVRPSEIFGISVEAGAWNLTLTDWQLKSGTPTRSTSVLSG